MAEDFKVKFNPLIPLLRLIWLIAAGGFLARVLYVGFTQFLADASKSILVLLGGGLLGGYFFYVPLKGLIRNSKMYSVSRSYLMVTDLIGFKSEKLDRESIKGFSESKIKYRIGSFKQIIIYLKDNRKLEIMQFEHFNFNQIKKIMIDYGYNYLGFEPYQWKFPDSRVYLFD